MDEQIKEKMKRDYLELQADEDYYKDKFEDKENKKSCGARKMKNNKKMDFITNLYNGQFSFVLVAAAISKQRVTISEEAIDLYGNKIEGSFGVYSNEKDLSKFWKIFDELIHRAR